MMQYVKKIIWKKMYFSLDGFWVWPWNQFTIESVQTRNLHNYGRRTRVIIWLDNFNGKQFLKIKLITNW